MSRAHNYHRPTTIDEAVSLLAIDGHVPLAGGTLLNADDDPTPVIERALSFLAGSASPLLLVPMEDLAGLVEQPNLPGTTTEHPNWRRRLPAPIDALLAEPAVQRRIACLTKARPAAAEFQEDQP